MVSLNDRDSVRSSNRGKKRCKSKASQFGKFKNAADKLEGGDLKGFIGWVLATLAVTGMVAIFKIHIRNVEAFRERLIEAAKASDSTQVVRIFERYRDMNPNFVDREERYNPLHIATMAGSRGVVSALLAHGVDPNVKDWMGRTPLHYAVTHGNLAVAEILLQHGADPNIADRDGKRPVDLLKEMMESDPNNQNRLTYQALLNLLESYEDRE